MKTTAEELNTRLYEKMFAEQKRYREWLLLQPREEILNHAYEYFVREDILLSLEEHELSPEQVRAMLQSPIPLADVFKEFEKWDTGYMDTVWDAIESRAKTALERSMKSKNQEVPER